MIVASFGFVQSCARPAQQIGARGVPVQDEILALERAALGRWITGDPEGYLSLYATDVSYFDPTQDARVDGLEAIESLLAPLRNFGVQPESHATR